MKITLIGLGTCAGDLTLRAKAALDNCGCIIARTSECVGFESVKDYSVRTLDGVFSTCRNFDTLNKKLAAEVLKAAKEQPVCYLVDGSVAEDAACGIILSKHRDCEVMDSVSKANNAYNTARLKSRAPVSLSAYSIEQLKSCRAALIYDIDCDYVAANVKLKLCDMFGDEAACAFIRGGKAQKIKVYEIDRMKNYDSTCAVAVEEGEFLKKGRYDYEDLLYIMRLLRAPGGCPWDGSQTPESIRMDMLEEAYELVDAIERQDVDGIEEETGDVLLQAAFHSVMAEERGQFSSADVISRIVNKLITRHSHIFGGDHAGTESEALKVWEKNKVKEKGQNTVTDTLNAVPKNFPACMYAQKVGKRASKCGFDFLSSVSAAEKLFEEAQELIDRLLDEDKEGAFEESGDLMFAAVNTVRLAGVDAEEALRAAAQKFVKRFSACEKLILADGKKIEDITGDGLLFDYYWEMAKNEVKPN